MTAVSLKIHKNEFINLQSYNLKLNINVKIIYFIFLVQTVLIVIQFGFLFLNLASQTDDVNDLAANTITVNF